jgi:hypothetical protein
VTDISNDQAVLKRREKLRQAGARTSRIGIKYIELDRTAEGANSFSVHKMTVDGSGQVKFWIDHGSPLTGVVATVIAGSSTISNAATFISSIMNAPMFHTVKKSLTDIDTKIEILPTKEDLDAKIGTLGENLNTKIEALPTKQDLDAKIGALGENLNTKIEALPTKEDLDAKIDTLATKEELKTLIDKLPTTADFDLLMAKITGMTELQERNLQSETKHSSVLSEQQR